MTAVTKAPVNKPLIRFELSVPRIVLIRVPPLDPETPDCDYAARGSLSIWSRRNCVGERCPWRSISQLSL